MFVTSWLDEDLSKSLPVSLNWNIRFAEWDI